jgi:Dockerin type I domain
MKRCNLILLPVLFAGFASRAQLVNDGAIIKIQPGAVLFCAGNVENKNAGSISNDGKLEVQGNFLNTATYTTATADDSLILSGGGNVTLNAGASTLSFLHINKTSNSNFVTLANSVTIGSKLIYNSGTLSTDPIANPYTLNAAAAVPFEFTAGREIVGRVRRTGWTNGAARVFNQPNMQVTTNGGTNPSEITVNMIPEANAGDPTLTEREVKRKFGFTQTGGSGFTADIRYPYLDAELNTNTEANLVPWQLIASEWNGRLTPVTRDGTANYVSTTGIPAADLANEWKLADPRYTMNATALLRGPWNGATMNTNLNSGGIIPLSQPYNTTPFNYTGTESVGSIPNANVVDWILVEFRKPASGLPADAASATIIGRKAGFLLNTGAIVETDGVTPIGVDISKQGAGFMVIRHRNHLGVMSVSLPSNVLGTYTNDFRSLTNSYKAVGASSDPVMLLAGGVHYGLWAGDANKSGVVNGTDISAIKNAIAASTTGYVLTDVNISNSINGTDVSLAKAIIAVSGSGSTPGRVRIVTTNIPDPLGPEE